MKAKYLVLPALIAALAVPAFAQHGGADRPSLRDLDADGDGAITREEADAPRLEHFASIDSDGDGVLTLAEMEAAHERRMAERRAERFARMDADGDGTVSLDEFSGPRSDRRFGRADANDDGVISAEEIADLEARMAERGERRWRRGRPGGRGS